MGCKEIQPVHPNIQISPQYSLEGPSLKLKLQYFGYLMRRTDSFEKSLMLGKIEGGRGRRQQRMRWLNDITSSMHTAGSQHGESHPWQRSWGKGPDKMQRRDQASGVPLDFLEHLPPKPESACLTALCFPPILLTFPGRGELAPTTFLWKKLT